MTRRPNRLPTTEDLHSRYCTVCRNTGKTYLEHPDGSLSEEPCPYCRGRKNLVWWEEREMAHQDRISTRKALIYGYTSLLLLTFRMPIWAHDYALKWVHGLMFVLLLVGLVWAYTHPAPSKRQRRGPNPLTTDRERLMGGAVIGGAMLKSELDHRFPRHG